MVNLLLVFLIVYGIFPMSLTLAFQYLLSVYHTQLICILKILMSMKVILSCLGRNVSLIPEVLKCIYASALLFIAYHTQALFHLNFKTIEG
jgi:hypothetical protein